MKWIEKCLKIKKDRIIVKQYMNDVLLRSIVYPTAKYPLGSGEIKVFHEENCNICTNERALEIFDSIDYKIGHCYDNATRLIEKLKENNIPAKSYVGWLYTGEYALPVHHSWVVIEDSVLDMADDFTMLCSHNKKKLECASNKLDIAEIMADFHKYIRKNRIKNSERCYPVGKPFPDFLYIGTEMEPDMGRSLYQNLMREYPNHEIARNVNGRGVNLTQKVILDRL